MRYFPIFRSLVRQFRCYEAARDPSRLLRLARSVPGLSCRRLTLFSWLPELFRCVATALHRVAAGCTACKAREHALRASDCAASLAGVLRMLAEVGVLSDESVGLPRSGADGDRRLAARFTMSRDSGGQRALAELTEDASVAR